MFILKIHPHKRAKSYPTGSNRGRGHYFFQKVSERTLFGVRRIIEYYFGANLRLLFLNKALKMQILLGGGVYLSAGRIGATTPTVYETL